jgi:hypothetical protein
MASAVVVELAVVVGVAVVVEVEVAVARGVPFGPPVPQNVHHHIDYFIR